MRIERLALCGMAAAGVMMAAASQAAASAFLPGDIVVYRADGTGTGGTSGTLAGTGNSIVLDEYQPDGTLRQSIPLTIFTPGNSSSEGDIALSPNGQYLTVTGYASTTSGTNITNTTANVDGRVVQILGASGTVLSTTTLGESNITGNLRSAVTDNGSNLWVTGASMGVRYVTAGASTSDASPSVNITGTTSSNYRQVNIYGGQLYLSTNDGNHKLNTVGTGLPTTPTQDVTALNGIPGSGLSPYQFAFFDLNPSVAGVDTLYVADDTGTTGGIQKYSFDGTTWSSSGTIGAGTTIRGLAAEENSDGSISMYASNGNTSSTKNSVLYSVTDATGWNGVPTATLSQFASIPGVSSDGTLAGGYRGVAFVPAGTTSVPEPATLSLGIAGASMLLLGRRRR